MRAYFDRQGWAYETMEDAHLLRCPFDAEAGRWATYADARSERDQLLVYSVLEAACPAERRPAMAEFLTLANYGLVVGNFEMDWSDGEVRCKTSLDLEGAELAAAPLEALAANVVEANLRVTYRYVPGVVAVMSGATPAEEIARIDG